MSTPDRPHVAILGAGPIGLEAALAAAERGLPFTLYEASAQIAGGVRDWSHVRLFSPWSLDVSPRARRRLAEQGIEPPDDDRCPTGSELVERVLQPLAELPELAGRLALATRVVAVGRQGLTKSDEIGTGGRAGRRFRLLVENGPGRRRVEHADLVLDCTGSYAVPNSLGDGGIPAPGEDEAERAGLLARRIPDISGKDRDRYAGATVLVAGSGHSAQTAVQALAALAEEAPGTRVLWLLRRSPESLQPIAKDPLPERARLMARAGEIARGASPAVSCLVGSAVEELALDGHRVRVVLRAADGSTSHSTNQVAIDRILSLTGSVGDHTLYRQLQVHECYATSGPMKLAAALLGESGGGSDCLAQPALGAETLRNPEPGFFILGAKSYGRNTTFLMRTGWQQVEDALVLVSTEKS